MKFSHRISLVLLLSIAHAGLCFGSNLSSESGRQYVPGQIIVKFKKEAGRVETSRRAQALLSKTGISSMRKAFPQKQYDPTFTVDKVGLGQIYLLNVASTVDIPALAERLQNDPTIQYAEPNYISYADIDSVIPNDPSYVSEQHLPQVKAAQAWAIAQGDTNVILAVLDTGTDWNHPDLEASIWKNNDEIPNNGIDDDGNGYTDDTRGWDFVDGITGGAGSTDPDPNDDLMVTDNDPMDFQGHGTHVAGITSAVTNNSVGIASLAWKCKIMPLRIGFRTNDNGGSGADLWMAEAFVYAGDNGATAANLSFGPIVSQLVYDAARYAFLQGVVVCNSAGNGNSEGVSGLGALPYALAVAAVAKNNVRASYSSYGKDVDISAPGGDFGVSGDGGMLSTIVNPSAFYGNQLYARFQGTSMASPMVASLAGLIKSYHPTWSPAQIMFQIIGTADNIDGVNPSYAGKLGSGRINAYRALTETPPAPAPKLSISSIVVSDAAGGNNDGKLDPGETGAVIVTVQNDWGDAGGVAVSFSVDHSAITPGNTFWNIGAVTGLSDLANSTTSNESIPFTVSVHAQAVPMVIPTTITLTANGGISIVKTFYLSITPSVLFVDDHTTGGDGTNVAIQSYYSSAFLGKNIPFAEWDHGVLGSPPASVLNNYSTVVWGCEWAFPSLDSADRASLGSYLDGGGRLFLSGQDIGWDMCDNAAGNPNEYFASNGASKTWFETYLGAQYLGDDANGGSASTTLTGVPDDDIGNGFTFSAAEPNRDAANQYPDILQSLAGATDVFRYASNSAGAVRFTSGSHSSVYFGFGGLESITNPATRDSVFLKVYSWLQQKSLDFTLLPDQEDSTSPSPMTAEVYSGIDAIQSVDLYWNNDGQFPFNVVPMTGVGGSYSATIPAQNMTTDVTYFVLVKTAGGAIPVDFRTFHTGIDRTPPEASFVKMIANSIKHAGPFSVEVRATDNIRIDTNNIYLFYNVNGGTEDSVQLHFSGTDLFSGSLTFGSPLASGSKVNYYVRVRDGSANKNETLLPSAGDASFRIGLEVIDDFEQDKLQWNYGTSWGRTTTSKRSGLYSITDSPAGNYAPNATNTLTLTSSLDLSGYSSARLFFWRSHFLAAFDTVFAEQSSDGVNWAISKFMRGTSSGWAQDSITLPAGSGAENVLVRFRLRSIPLAEATGIFIDDIMVRTDSFLLTGVSELHDKPIPVAYSLAQNYPNPFNPKTTFEFQIINLDLVSLKVYNVLGQEVATLVNEVKPAGTYQVDWDASNMSSGVYFYRIQSGKFSATKKLMLLK